MPNKQQKSKTRPKGVRDHGSRSLFLAALNASLEDRLNKKQRKRHFESFHNDTYEKSEAKKNEWARSKS